MKKHEQLHLTGTYPISPLLHSAQILLRRTSSDALKTLFGSLKRMIRNIKANHGGERYGRNE